MEQLLDEIISTIGIHDTFLNETKQERLEVVCKSLGILRKFSSCELACTGWESEWREKPLHPGKELIGTSTIWRVGNDQETIATTAGPCS